jgi:hypothetical protein
MHAALYAAVRFTDVQQHTRANIGDSCGRTNNSNHLD